MNDKLFESAFAQLPEFVDEWKKRLDAEVAGLVQIPSHLSLKGTGNGQVSRLRSMLRGHSLLCDSPRDSPRAYLSETTGAAGKLTSFSGSPNDCLTLNAVINVPLNSARSKSGLTSLVTITPFERWFVGMFYI